MCQHADGVNGYFSGETGLSGYPVDILPPSVLVYPLGACQYLLFLP